MIPLDGSGLAETVLPTAVYLATALKSQVTLLHVVEENASPVIHGDRHLTAFEEADAYLAGIQRQYCAALDRFQRRVQADPARDVAAAILAQQAASGADFIIMCTHGRGGVRQLLFGSIAQQVVESGQTPVLIIRPETDIRPETKPIDSLFIATDNDSEHWQALETAFELARKIRARLHVLGVVPTMGALAGKQATLGRFLPATTYHVLEMVEAQLRSFLAEKTRELQAAGVGLSLEVKRGNPAALIVRMADAAAADVIILGTHGKAGTAALLSGSVAARVLKRTLRPLMLLPVKAGRT